MRTGDQLIFSLVASKKPVNLSKVISKVCEYVDNENDYAIKRLLGYLMGNTCSIRRPPGCIQFIYEGVPYWRDGWDNLYSNLTCRKVGVYYRQLDNVVLNK